jgi:hypothetical protein
LIEGIGPSTFQDCGRLQSVKFQRISCLKKIHGFRDCGNLPQIEIFESVEVISDAFNHCKPLAEIAFAPNG